jgi:hypothetical protein
MTQKYNSRQKYGTGWFNESHRHSLARQGIKTGRKSNYTPVTLMGLTTEHKKDIKRSFSEIDYYKISSISDKDKVELIRGKIANMLRDKGYSASVEIKNGSINLRDIRISDDRVKEQGHNLQQTGSTKSGIRKTRSLSWEDWVEVNDSVNSVLDSFNVSANVKSLGGKFDIRDKKEGRRSESDWEHLSGENVGSMMSPMSRSDYITRPEKKQCTQFGVMSPEGKVTKEMTIDINKVKSSDPLAYSYGYFQGKSGQPMSKDKDLAPEYIRGYKDAKAGKKIDMAKITVGKGYDYAFEPEWYKADKRRLKKLENVKENTESHLLDLTRWLESERESMLRSRKTEDKKYFAREYKKRLDELHAYQRLLTKVNDTISDMTWRNS